MEKKGNIALFFAAVAILFSCVMIPGCTTDVNTEPVSYKVTVSENDKGSITASEETATEGTVVTVTATVKATGYELDKIIVTGTDGKSVEVSDDNTFKMPSQNVTVSAKFKAIEYKINYELDGGTNSAENPAFYTIESDFIFSDAEKLGNGFKGWFDKDGYPVTKIEKGSTGEITLIAKWSTTYFSIKYELDGGFNSYENPSSYTVESDFTFAYPDKSGYEFLGWFDKDDNQVTEIKYGSVGDITLTAKWKIITYKITYELDGGTNSDENPAEYTIENGVTLADPEKLGYDFKGWFNKDDIRVTGIIRGTTGNTTFTAKWSPTVYKITYELGGGSNSSENLTLYTIEDEITFVDAERTGYEFDCWLDKDGNKVEKIEKGTAGDISLTANWTPISYNITYELGSGTNVKENPSTYTIESEFTFADAERTGYDFSGWLDKDGNEVKKIEKGTMGGITLTATWTVVNYLISYELGGGTNAAENQASYTIEDEIVIADAKRTGYDFSGWYDSDGNKVESISKGTTGVLSLTARWTPIAYSITYEVGGGTNAELNPLTYTIESEFTFSDPERSGYAFKGWYNQKGNKVESISKGTIGDLILTANWEKNSVSVSVSILTNSDIGITVSNPVVDPETNKITLTADDGYTDYSWLIDGTAASSFTGATVSADGKTLVIEESAVKAGARYQINVSAKDGAIVYGAQVKLEK